MARPKKAPPWRGPFLRALGRTGCVSAAALEAGVDKSSVYARRKADAGFAARLEEARARGKAAAASGRRPPKTVRVELILRNGRDGPKWVKPSAGRWCRAAEDSFLAMLRQTGCVRWAAAEAGFSTTALYNRRKLYPQLAADWAAAEAEARERVPGFLAASSIATFDPAVALQLAGEGLPKVTVDQAIAIARMKGFAGGAAAEEDEPSIEAVRESILRKLDAIEAHERGQD